MSGDRSTPPGSIPKYIPKGGNRQDAEDLCCIATYTNALAGWQDAQQAQETDDEDTVSEDSIDDKLELGTVEKHRCCL